MNRTMAVLWACVSLLVAATAVSAQTSVGGSIRGYVRDEQGAVMPGVTLTAASPTVPGMYTAVTDREGYYRLVDLPPGEYATTAEIEGFAQVKRPGIVVRAGLNLGLDLVMILGPVTETVEVRAETPMLEAQSAVQAVNISGDSQRELPLNNRSHWSDFLAMTPGVVATQLTARMADSFQLRGADFTSHAIQIDGADMASGQQNATYYVNIPQEAIADVQVKTGTVDPSSPLGVGAVINIATKSGTNTPQGALSMSIQRRGWANNNNPRGTLAAVDALLPEAAIGGPIVPDRAWFFAAYRFEHMRSGIARTPQQVTTLRALKPDFQPFDAEVDGHYLFTKASWQWSGKHQSELFYSFEPQHTAGERAGATDAGLFVKQTNGGGRNFAFRLSSAWGSRLMTRFGASYNNKALQISAGKDLPTRPVYGSVVPSGGTLIGSGQIAILDNGNFGNSYDQPYYKSTVFGDLTYFHHGWMGSHELRGGFYLQPKNHQASYQIFANKGFSIEELVLVNRNDPSQGVIPFHRTSFDRPTNVNALTDTRDFAFYIQDSWQPTGRFTLSAGVRVDAIRRIDRIFDVVVQNHTDIGPRVGVNWALTEDRQNLVRASWARVHDVLSTNNVSAGTSTAAKLDLYDRDLDGVFETVLATPAASAVASDRIFDLNRGQPYIDEWTAGYRRQLPGRVIVDAGFNHREYRSQTALVERNGIYENGVFKGYRDERLNQIYELTGNTWNWQVYNGLELQVIKDTARLRVLGSYTRSWRHIAGTWQPNDPAAFIQPAAFANDKNVGGTRGNPAGPTNANGLSGTSMTSDPNNNTAGWQDHIARVTLAYNAPARLVIAGSYVLQSGAYGGPVVTRIAAPDPQFGPPTVRLAIGRVVSNPLATTIRFAYANRGEGQLKLPALQILNLRVGRQFSLARAIGLELALDVFNVLNGDADQAFQSGANQLFSANYAGASSRQSPRSFRIYTRLAF